MTLGQMIQEYREAHGMSQRTFARRAGLSNVQIAYLERGVGSNGKPFKPSVDTIVKVSRAMGSSPEMILAQCDDFVFTLKDSDLTDDDQIAYLLFDGEPVSRSQIEEVKRFAKWILERDKK